MRNEPAVASDSPRTNRRLHRSSWMIIAFMACVCGYSMTTDQPVGAHRAEQNGWNYSGDGFQLGSPAVYWVVLESNMKERGGVHWPVQPATTIVKFSALAVVVNLGTMIATGAVLVGISEAVQRRQFGLRAFLLWMTLVAVALSMILSARKASIGLTDPEPPPYAPGDNVPGLCSK